MEVFKRLSVFGLNFYVSNAPMKRMRPLEMRRHMMRKKLRLLKEKVYKGNGGICEECGQQFLIRELEVHHIIEVHENPFLMCSLSNIRLLCPECHRKVHEKKGT